RLLERRLAAAVEDSVVDLLHQRSNGNPLFLTRLIEPLIAGGALIEKDGVWQTAAGAHLETLPPSLTQIVEPLLARLAEEEIEILEAASVVGFEWTTAAVAACL